MARANSRPTKIENDNLKTSQKQNQLIHEDRGLKNKMKEMGLFFQEEHKERQLEKQQKRGETKRELSTYDPCLSYTDEDNCYECDADNGYYLLLYNSTMTICAYSDEDTLSWWDYESQVCVIEYDYYPEQYDFYWEAYWYDYYYAESSDGIGYCYNEYLYFMTDELYNYICDAVEILYEVTDVYLSTVYTKTVMYCLSCGISPYLNAELRAYDTLGVYVGMCSEVTDQGNEYCTYTQYYDTDSGSCLECTTKFKHCAACDATTCLMCLENYIWNDAVYDYATQSYDYGECIFQTCPQGQCYRQETGGCVESEMDSCLRCEQFYYSYSYTWSGTTYTYSYEWQECQYCMNGYYNYYGECYEYESTYITEERFLTSDVLLLDPDTEDTYEWDIPSGLTPETASYSLGDVFNRIMSSNQEYAGTTATIYVGKGEHFYYMCDGDEYLITYYKNDTNNLADYCNTYDWEYLQRTDYFNDNFTITIEALDCAYAEDLGYENDAYFLSMCVDFDAGESRPIIYVANAISYFNISGSLTVKRLIFSGINGLAYSPVAGYNIGVFPYLLCDIAKEPNGVDSTIQLETILYDDVNFAYYCADPYYSGSSIPESASETTTCTSNSNGQFSSTQQSSLSCPGVPTDDTFFTQSLFIYQYFRRRWTLFNLYAYADHNTVRNSPPELHIDNCDFEYFFRNFESLVNIETNNFIRVLANMTKYNGYYDQSDESRGYFLYNQADRGAKISITDSNFKHSRFCKGMIVYRPAPYDDSVSLVNFTHIYMDTPVKQDNGSYIYIYNSTFTNLNAFKNVTALAIYGGERVDVDLTYNSIDPVSIPAFMHKGIVLNVEDFNG